MPTSCWAICLACRPALAWQTTCTATTLRACSRQLLQKGGKLQQKRQFEEEPSHQPARAAAAAVPAAARAAAIPALAVELKTGTKKSVSTGLCRSLRGGLKGYASLCPHLTFTASCAYTLS